MNFSKADAIISHSQIVSGNPLSGGSVAKGLSVSLPALENASNQALNELEDQENSMLRLLKPDGIKMQLRWSQDGDYEDELLAYHDRTEEYPDRVWGRRQRNQNFLRFSNLRMNGQLRRERVSLFLGTSLRVGKGGRKAQVEESLAATSRSLDVSLNEVSNSIRRLGGRTEPLDDLGLFEECYRYFNPSVSRFRDGFLQDQFQPHESILHNCLSGDLTPVDREDAGFYYDGHYHGFLTLKRLPTMTASGMIRQLSGLPIRDFSMVVNIEALDVLHEMEFEEGQISKLEQAVKSSPRSRMLSALQLKRERVQRLMSGEVMPYSMEFIFHAWASDFGGLQDKLGGLKSAINLMQGSQYWEMSLPTTARNAFLAGMPGKLPQKQDFHLKVEGHTASNLLPIIGGVNGSLMEADALFYGNNGSVFGASIFQGDSPVHTFVCGMTGSGKSVFVMELLTQTEPEIEFTVIIDDGLSYGCYVEVAYPEAKTLIIEPSGKETLNYLDTRGKPLTAQHLSDATAVLHLMSGHKSDEEEDFLKGALLSSYLRKFYVDWSKRWLERNPTRAEELINLSHEQEAGGLESGPLTDVKSDAETGLADGMMCQSFSLMGKDDMPTHSAFTDWLAQEASLAERHQQKIYDLIDALGAWRSDVGSNGAIFDGINTVDFSGRMVHLELGRTGDAKSRLRQIASFIVASMVRNEIIRRPRDQPKRVVFEEVGSFLAIEQGVETIRDFAERSRKQLCLTLFVIQQISNLPDDVARSVLGNCRQGFFFRQEYEKDVRVLQETFHLPDATASSLMRFDEPSPEKGAPFICWQSSGAMPVITSGFNIATPEMLYVAGSGGKHFEQRKKALAQYDSALEGVIAETKKLADVSQD